jgi:hypothetical protein
MHRPLVAADLVPHPLPRLDVHAGQPELPAPRRLQVIPDGFAVVAPELMAGDLHVDRPLVHEALLRPVGADRPDAIHLVPRALVAIKEQGRVGRRELQVVEPGVLVADRPRFAGLDVGEDERHRGRVGHPPREALLLAGGRLLLRRQREVELQLLAEHPFALRQELPGLRAGRAATRVGRGDGADDDGLVGVDGEVATADDPDDFSDGFRVHVCGLQRPVAEEVDVARPPSRGECSAARDDEFGLRRLVAERRQVDRGDAGPRVEDELVAFGRVRVLMEIEAGTAGLGGEANDTMAGCGVDPVARRVVGGDSGGDEQQTRDGGAHDCHPVPFLADVGRKPDVESFLASVEA